MAWRGTALAALVLAVTACSGWSDATPTVTEPAPTLAPAAPASTAPTGPSSAPPAPGSAAPDVTSTSVAAEGGAPVGFDTVAGRVTAADGSTCDVCLWAAATADQQARGLMGVTDLSGADGMLFRFGGETTSQFWMRDTPTPLSNAFFAGDGTFVSSVDMTPCVEGPAAACDLYSAAGPYTDAVEVARGRLPDLLMTAGSRLDVLDQPCPLTD
jgi:uncharacterized membrane protein (UPF0127 family)